ncbi:thiamine pyrophosphate-requiring protein [Silvimonas sp. JCM 19000]
MAQTTSEFLVDRLAEWGVRRVFGYPGDGINGVMGALRRTKTGIDFIQVRHEEMAAFMATAQAKFGGGVGVCMATSGPGAIHLLNGLYDAKADHQPVVAIIGQQKRSALGSHYQQEVDLANLFADVSDYVQMVVDPAQLRHVIDRAFRIAQAHRTVTTIILPNDIQELPAVPLPPRVHGSVFSGVGLVEPNVQPSSAALHEAAAILNAGQKVAILVGAGALHATAEVEKIADVLGAGVAKALLGKAVLPDELPWVTGSIGLLGTKASWDLMQECDTLLMIGSSFPYSEFLPEPGKARGVQIDIDPAMINLRYPMDAALVGDTKLTLQALLPLLQSKTDRSWQNKVMANVRDWWQTLRNRAMVDASPLNPQRVLWELSPLLPERAIVCADSGSVANWYARDVKLRPGMSGSLSGGLASMGAGVPYAIGAKFTHPDRPVIALMGDGAMQMNGNAELVTVAKYWKQWADPRFVVLVLNNRDLNQVTWEQRAMEGDAKFSGSQDLPDFSYAAYAELLGFKGIRIGSPEEVAPAWQEAFAAGRPCLIEAYTDPDVPPLPPHFTFEQARNYLSAILKGDPDAGAIIRAAFKQIRA